MEKITKGMLIKEEHISETVTEIKTLASSKKININIDTVVPPPARIV